MCSGVDGLMDQYLISPMIDVTEEGTVLSFQYIRTDNEWDDVEKFRVGWSMLLMEQICLALLAE
jgi:hypothetical protein